eukprot:TRINITY_DN106_c0_g1_i2.p1 TRINITY_DN106_c0_g1~~TRINITY_DN106_c0_g1_i2.p1  ORF type:complete len:145 (-),score=0.20 TRINITY_DN106_c0_g1_i2:103-537(-)
MLRTLCPWRDSMMQITVSQPGLQSPYLNHGVPLHATVSEAPTCSPQTQIPRQVCVYHNKTQLNCRNFGCIPILAPQLTHLDLSVPLAQYSSDLTKGSLGRNHSVVEQHRYGHRPHTTWYGSYCRCYPYSLWVAHITYQSITPLG